MPFTLISREGMRERREMRRRMTEQRRQEQYGSLSPDGDPPPLPVQLPRQIFNPVLTPEQELEQARLDFYANFDTHPAEIIQQSPQVQTETQSRNLNMSNQGAEADINRPPWALTGSPSVSELERRSQVERLQRSLESVVQQSEEAAQQIRPALDLAPGVSLGTEVLASASAIDTIGARTTTTLHVPEGVTTPQQVEHPEDCPVDTIEAPPAAGNRPEPYPTLEQRRANLVAWDIPRGRREPSDGEGRRAGSDNEQLRSTTERFRQLNQQGTQAQLRRGAISGQGASDDSPSLIRTSGSEHLAYIQSSVIPEVRIQNHYNTYATSQMRADLCCRNVPAVTRSVESEARRREAWRNLGRNNNASLDPDYGYDQFEENYSTDSGSDGGRVHR